MNSLPSWTYDSYGCPHKTCQDQVSQHSNIEQGGAHDLLLSGDSWRFLGESQSSLRLAPSKPSLPQGWPHIPEYTESTNWSLWIIFLKGDMNLRFMEVGVGLGGIEIFMIKKHLWVGVDQGGSGHQYD